MFREIRGRKTKDQVEAERSKEQLANDVKLAIGDMKRVEGLLLRVAALEEVVAGLINALMSALDRCEREGIDAIAEPAANAAFHWAQRHQPWTLEDEDG